MMGLIQIFIGVVIGVFLPEALQRMVKGKVLDLKNRFFGPKNTTPEDVTKRTEHDVD